MRKLWIRWIVLVVLVGALGALFVRLGEWQLHRLAWRKGNNAQVETYEKAPVKPYQDVFRAGHTITDPEQWQRVTATGTFDTRQFQAMYRSRGKEHGSEVITPLHTTRGEWLLVNRGFLVRADGAPEVAVLPAPPTGTVTVTGYVRRNEKGKPNQVTPDEGDRVQLVAAPEIGTALGRPVLDGYLGATQVKPAQQGNLQPMQLPTLTEGPHLSYAIQWFCFTAIAAAGVVILIRTDLKDRRKARLKAERRAQRGAAERPQDSVGPRQEETGGSGA